MANYLEEAISNYREGKMEKALEGFLKSAELDPSSTIAHYNAAVIYQQQNNLEMALEHYRLAHASSPEDPDILFNLALALKQSGRIEEALDCYFDSLELNPRDTEARYNLGTLLMETGLLKEAASCFREVLEIDPHHASACNNLAYLYHRQGMIAEALEKYDHLLKIDPSHKTAAHMKAALTGDNPAKPPAKYIQDVFDQFHDYDTTMQENLGYNTPEKLFNLLCESLPEKRRFDHILDLGCGTGLSGIIFRDMADRLTGVDLSLTMLARAEEKKIYNQLEQEEIISFLNKSNDQYDLFLAADVFVYSGDLFPILEEISRRSSPGGFLLFSTESTEEGFLLRETGRYAHSSDYLLSTAEQCDLQLVKSRSANIRKEKGEWIKGGLYLFEVKA